MKILTIDTTGQPCCAALSEDRRLVTEIYLNTGLTHSERLMPIVDEVLRQARADKSEIGLIAAVCGPGSFTGIRIGVCAAKGLAQGLGVPCVAVCTLDSLARNLAGHSGVICPVMDARRGEVYNALYRGDSAFTRLEGPRALPLKNVLNELLRDPAYENENVVFVGDGALAYGGEILSASPRFEIAPENFVLQRASSAALIAYEKYSAGDFTDCYGLKPYYLRPSQAERLSLNQASAVMSQAGLPLSGGPANKAHTPQEG